MNNFGVWRFCGYLFGVHNKTGPVLGVISKHFRVFSKGQCTEWRYCFGLLKFHFFGMPDIPGIFGKQ